MAVLMTYHIVVVVRVKPHGRDLECLLKQELQWGLQSGHVMDQNHTTIPYRVRLMERLAKCKK